MMLTLVSVAFAEPPCVPTTLEDVRASVTQGDLAFYERQPAALHGAALAARQQVGCLTQPIDIPLAGAVYRLWAYDAFVTKNRDDARRFFEVARDLQPGVELSDAVVPEFHPMRELFESIEATPGPTKLLDLPEGSTARVNGIDSLVYPTDRPWLLQQLVDGRVVLSTYVETGTSPPVLVGNEKEPFVWGLSALGGVRYWSGNERSTPTFGATVLFDGAIVGPLAVEGGLHLAVGPVSEGLTLVPDVRMGARAQFGEDAQPRIGAALLLASHGYAAVAPGVALTGGWRNRSWDLDAIVGFAGGFTVGVGFGRRLR